MLYLSLHRRIWYCLEYEFEQSFYGALERLDYDSQPRRHWRVRLLERVIVENGRNDLVRDSGPSTDEDSEAIRCCIYHDRITASVSEWHVTSLLKPT